MRFRHITRSGRYVRVVDPDWREPLDPTFAAVRGGRWNPPVSFPLLYLCGSRGVARHVVWGRFLGLPYGPLDLRADRRPALVETVVPGHRAVDVITDAGCRAASLPVSYPFDARGRKLGWARTQPVGLAAWGQGERSIACRSAALPRGEDGEELAWFVRDPTDRLTVSARRSFDQWFSRGSPSGLDAGP